MKFFHPPIYLLLSVLIFGCAYSNEGAVDLRRVNTTSNTVTINQSDTAPKENIISAPLHKLSVKNFSLGRDEDVAFKKGDSLSIHLRSAFIKTFAEDHYITPLFTKALTRQWGKADGEIAIVVNAMEMKGQELSFTKLQEGRVAFYSNDVNEGQFLNFNNMPIYGPLEFEGFPVAFRISILELDVASAQGKAILQTVAYLGGKAYAPASPVLEVLNGLGQTLLSGEQTDTEFRYAMILDPQHGSSKLNHFVLEAGNYILVRKEKRAETFDWDSVKFNENDGRLYKTTLNNGKPELFREQTYVVIEINKNISNKSVELAQNNFGTLIDTLNTQDNAAANNWQHINTSLKKVSQQREQKSNFIDAKSYIANIKNAKANIQKLDNNEQENANTLQLTINAREDLKSVIALIKKSYKDGNYIAFNTNNNEAANLLETQVNYLLREIRVLAGTAITGNVDKLKLSSILDESKLTEIQNVIAPFPPAG